MANGEECLFVGGPKHFQWLRVEHLGQPCVFHVEEQTGLDATHAEAVYLPVNLLEPDPRTVFFFRDAKMRELLAMEAEIERELNRREEETVTWRG
jgi:hypothetical protein